MTLLLGGAGVSHLDPLQAGGPIIVVSGVAAKWEGSTAQITPDTGALGILDANLARANLLTAAAAWDRQCTHDHAIHALLSARPN